MSRSVLALFITASLATPALALAAEPTTPLVQPPAHTSQPPQKNPTDKDAGRMVCKAGEATGSRLPTAKTCMTKAEWDQRAMEQRQALERAQDNRPYDSR